MTEDERKQWLDLRRKGIGGSDVAPVCGASPWKSAYQVYQEKIGDGLEIEDNEPMYWGRALEPIIRQRYATDTGLEVYVPGPMEVLQHDKYPFMQASLDGIVPGDRVLEVKTARSAQGWGEPGTDDIPEVYLLQVQHYMTVTKLSLADVAVLIGGSDFRIYTVENDPELAEMMVQTEADFWERVEKREPPDLVTYSDIQARFGKKSEERKVQATEEVKAALLHLQQLKDIKKAEEDLKAKVMKHMGECDTLVDADGKVLATWKLAKPGTMFDSKTLKESDPETYQKYLKNKAASRRFLIK